MEYQNTSLLQALSDLVNLILSGDLPTAVSEILFGSRLLALDKKDGGNFNWLYY